MVLALIFIPVIFLTALVLFNVTQVSTEKQKLQNTVDAMAYSVALMEARDLNFVAYMNRAMVANQVAVAQAVSFVSWFRFVEGEVEFAVEVIDALTALLEVVPVVGEIMDVIDEAANTALEVVIDLQEGNTEVMSAFVSVLNGWLTVLSVFEQVFHYATVDSGLETLFAVKQANDPDVSIATAGGVGGVANAIDFYFCFSTRAAAAKKKKWQMSNNSPYLERFAETAMKSRDGFSANRGYGRDLFKKPQPIIKDWVTWNATLGRWGGADFDRGAVEGKETWYVGAVDTFSLSFNINYALPDLKHCHWYCATSKNCWCWNLKHGWHKCCCLWDERLSCPKKWHSFSVSVPNPAIGGSAYAGKIVAEPLDFNTSKPWVPYPSLGGKTEDLSKPFSKGFGGAVQRDAVNVFAAADKWLAEADESIGTYSGIQPYISVKNLKKNTTDSAALILQVGKPVKKTTAQIKGLGAGPYDMSAQSQDTMYAAAKADARFSRAAWARPDGKTEYGNLFNPYWEAKLAPLTEAERKDIATWDTYKDHPGDIFQDLETCVKNKIAAKDYNLLPCIAGFDPEAILGSSNVQSCLGK